MSQFLGFSDGGSTPVDDHLQPLDVVYTSPNQYFGRYPTEVKRYKWKGNIDTGSRIIEDIVYQVVDSSIAYRMATTKVQYTVNGDPNSNSPQYRLLRGTVTLWKNAGVELIDGYVDFIEKE